MKNKKFISGILCTMLMISAFATWVSAVSFPDVENDPGVAWAKTYINEMADMGYIKGYDDGTFKPNKPITKTEALILLSRMVGVDSEAFANSVTLAVEEYKEVLNQYRTDYSREVSFLLYTGILSEGDLEDYISNSAKNQPLKRYEAAILLTKLLGADKEVENTAFVSSSYADSLEIPIDARAYVEYVKEQGIMQGMGENKDGKPEFVPEGSVTRSQMSKILYTLIDILNTNIQNGILKEIDTFENTATIVVDGESIECAVDESTVCRLNGKATTFEDMAEGINVNIVYIAGKAALIENVVTVEDTVVYGLVASTRESGSTKSVTIADVDDKKKTETFILDDDAKVKVEGAVDLFSKVKANNYVALTVKNGLVTELEVIAKNATVSGTLVYVDVTNTHTVLGIEDKSGITKEYEISEDGVVISRNNLDSSLAQLMEGDSITVKMTYGKVNKISVTSKNQSISGKLTSITHTVNGSTLSLEVNGKTKEYKVNKAVKILIDSTVTGTVYDLRPGTDVNIDMESSEVVSIKAAGSVEKSHIAGVVKSINVSYGLLVVEEDGVEYSVFCNNSTKILDSLTAKTLTLKNVEKGRKAIVTGSNASGVYEASTIILQ